MDPAMNMVKHRKGPGTWPSILEKEATTFLSLDSADLPCQVFVIKPYSLLKPIQTIITAILNYKGVQNTKTILNVLNKLTK